MYFRREAREHRGRHDCLVLDVHLGGLSGFDLQERLATSGMSTPVVIITAHDDASTRERARRAGAIEYLRKPFDDDSLIDPIHKAIGHSGSFSWRSASWAATLGSGVRRRPCPGPGRPGRALPAGAP